MMQDTTNRCAGRAEELLLRLDDGLEAAALQQFERHLAECAACARLAVTLRGLDRSLASQLSAPALGDAFDRAVLARVDALSQADPASLAERRVQVDRERAEALAGLRAKARRGIGTGLLDLVGVGAVLWAGGQLAPHLLDHAGQIAAIPSAVAGIVAAAAVAALAMAAAYLVARVEHFTASA